MIFQHALDTAKSPKIENATVVTLPHESPTACLMGISVQSTPQKGETVYVILSPIITLIVGEEPVSRNQDVLTYRCHNEWDLSGIKSFIEGNSEVNSSMFKS